MPHGLDPITKVLMSVLGEGCAEIDGNYSHYLIRTRQLIISIINEKDVYHVIDVCSLRYGQRCIELYIPGLIQRSPIPSEMERVRSHYFNKIFEPYTHVIHNERARNSFKEETQILTEYGFTNLYHMKLPCMRELKDDCMVCAEHENSKACVVMPCCRKSLCVSCMEQIFYVNSVCPNCCKTFVLYKTFSK